jgi:hypothetical protein
MSEVGLDYPGFNLSWTSPVCSLCVHLDRDRDLHLRCCRAFADIPYDIWLGKNKHTEPYPGDNGIQFEPRKKA